MARKKKVRRSDLKTGQVLCSFCNAKCCRYFSLQIDTPNKWADFDNMRWYLAHDKTAIFVEEDAWYLLINTKCRYLQTDYLCGIYEDRMEICEEYSTDHCDYDDDEMYDKFFDLPEQISEYAEAVLPPGSRPGARSGVNRLPILNAIDVMQASL